MEPDSPVRWDGPWNAIVRSGTEPAADGRGSVGRSAQRGELDGVNVGFFPVGPFIETSYANPASGGVDDTIQRRLAAMIDGAPVGAAIYGTFFSLDLVFIRDALVRANNRGSPVFIMHNNTDHANAIPVALSGPAPSGLGPNHRWSGRPFPDAAHRYGAIATGPGSDLHTKLFLFEATTDPEGQLRRNVCWWGSANCSLHSGTQKYNNAVAVYDDPTLFANFKSKLWDLLWDETHFPDDDFYNASQGRGTFEGGPATGFTAYCSPEQSTDLWVNRLALIDAGPATKVYVAMDKFFDSRAVVADQLVRIARARGAVQVAVGNDAGDFGGVVRTKLVGAGIPVRLVNIHDKLALVQSKYNGSAAARKIVFNGSHNLTQDANYVNDELLVKLFNSQVFDDMKTNHFDHLWATGAPAP
jgi:phosphatidylserine/phosphatidylglycerophosphate/cardiolipin synthase-like enzyme